MRKAGSDMWRQSRGVKPAACLRSRSATCPKPRSARCGPQLEFAPDSGIERVTMRLGSDGEMMLILESDSPEAPELELEATISVAHVFEGEVLLQAGEDHVRLRIMEREFRVSPTSFFQVNVEATEKLLEHVLRRIPTKVDTLLDVYCGVGLFSAFLAPRCRRLIGVEASAPACEDFGVNLDEFENVELYEDAAERALPTLDISPEVVVLDPPRAGLEIGVVDALARMQAPLVVYVSCDPATLATRRGETAGGGLCHRERDAVRHVPADVSHRERSLFTR